MFLMHHRVSSAGSPSGCLLSAPPSSTLSATLCLSCWAPHQLQRWTFIWNKCHLPAALSLLAYKDFPPPRPPSPGLQLLQRPCCTHLLPLQKRSIIWYISSGLAVLPGGGSSLTMMSVSQLAWMTWPSCARRTWPLMPIRQCSYKREAVGDTYKACTLRILNQAVLLREAANGQQAPHVMQPTCKPIPVSMCTHKQRSLLLASSLTSEAAVCGSPTPRPVNKLMNWLPASPRRHLRTLVRTRTELCSWCTADRYFLLPWSLLVLIQQMSSLRLKPHLLRQWRPASRPSAHPHLQPARRQGEVRRRAQATHERQFYVCKRLGVDTTAEGSKQLKG